MMTDHETAEAWKEYFPKCQRDREADQICRLICRVILETAMHEIKPPGRYNPDRVNRILRKYGIKKTEFSQVVAHYPSLSEIFEKFQERGLRKKTAGNKKRAPEKE